MIYYVFPGSLQIRHSQESDEGKYECVAGNKAGVAYSYGANLYVRGELNETGMNIVHICTFIKIFQHCYFNFNNQNFPICCKDSIYDVKLLLTLNISLS